MKKILGAKRVAMLWMLCCSIAVMGCNKNPPAAEADAATGKKDKGGTPGGLGDTPAAAGTYQAQVILGENEENLQNMNRVMSASADTDLLAALKTVNEKFQNDAANQTLILLVGESANDKVKIGKANAKVIVFNVDDSGLQRSFDASKVPSLAVDSVTIELEPDAAKKQFISKAEVTVDPTKKVNVSKGAVAAMGEGEVPLIKPMKVATSALTLDLSSGELKGSTDVAVSPAPEEGTTCAIYAAGTKTTKTIVIQSAVKEGVIDFSDLKLDAVKKIEPGDYSAALSCSRTQVVGDVTLVANVRTTGLTLKVVGEKKEEPKK